MKKFLQILIMAILVDSASALTLSEIQVAYQAQVLKIDEERKASIETLNKGYLKALEKIQKSFQKAGDLKRAVLVKEEAEAISKGTWPLPALPVEIDQRAGASRKLYLKSYVRIDRAWAISTTKASDKMISLLKDKRVQLTKSGSLEEAQKAQMLIDVINKDPEVVRARELPKRVSQGGQSRAAFVLRRGGDGVEVMVRYDSSGKVSFKSPVVNVVEQSEGKKERGETQAKNLGEFVGAKGFEVDPYVAFHETVESGKLEFSETIGLSSTKSTDVEDGPAMEFKIGKKVPNAYFRLAEVLSPLSAPATHRISCDYYIPKDNIKVVGFNLQHGGASGKPIGTATTAVGKWETAVFLGESGSTDTFLTGYLSGPTFKIFPTIGGDRIYIKSLKIEHIKFSAFIVESFGSNGNSTGKQTDPASQKMYIKNGLILPN